MSSDAELLEANKNAVVENPFTVLIALNRDAQPAVGEIAAKLRELFPNLQPVRDIVEEDTGFGFTLNGSIIVFLRVPGPIPLDPSMEDPTINKPLTAATLNAQRAYLVIVVREREPIQAAIAATEVTAAVADCCPYAIAIYWPAARQFVAPQVFVEQAVKQVHSHPPIDLWIDVRVWQLDDKQHHAAYTRGLRALGHKEFEVRRSPESAKDLRGRLEGLCSYVLSNGPIIHDGHTVGHDADERISILLCRSIHGLQELVLRLDYDEDFRPRRPWWKLI